MVDRFSNDNNKITNKPEKSKSNNNFNIDIIWPI